MSGNLHPNRGERRPYVRSKDFPLGKRTSFLRNNELIFTQSYLIGPLTLHFDHSEHRLTQLVASVHHELELMRNKIRVVCPCMLSEDPLAPPPADGQIQIESFLDVMEVPFPCAKHRFGMV